MSPLALQLLKRLALYLFVLAALLAVVPPVLTEFGVLGPSLAEQVESAEAALAAARVYGGEDLPAYVDARSGIDRARAFVRQERGRDARRAARQARAGAFEAQRLALARREDQRRRAEGILSEIDKLLNGLEDLYQEVTPGMEKVKVSRLLSLMKNARQTGASLFLAYEQGNYAKVLDDERGVKEVLLSVQQAFGPPKR